jgi:uncharacterized protein (TIRG00374 family)
MRNKKTEVAFLVIGIAVFAFLVWKFGLDRLTTNIAGAGWSLLGAVAVWFVIYFTNTIAWKLLLGESDAKVSFRRLFLVNVAGFAIDTITPIIALGGEPYKVKALSHTIGLRPALSTVLVYRMVHVLGHMLILFAGSIIALAFLELAPPVAWMLLASSAIILAIIALMFSGLRSGVFHRIRGFSGRIPILRRFLERHEQHFTELDAAVTHAYRSQRGKFYGALVLEFVSRAMMGVEVYLILLGTGVEISMISALLVYVTYSIVINLIFFVPLNLGVREGGLVLGLHTLALSTGVGIYLAVVLRIREFVWILLGLLLMMPLIRESDSVDTH